MARQCDFCEEEADVVVYQLTKTNHYFCTPVCAKHATKKPKRTFLLFDSLAQEQVSRELLNARKD